MYTYLIAKHLNYRESNLRKLTLKETEEIFKDYGTRITNN